jgi:GAF domain-containing protein
MGLPLSIGGQPLGVLDIHSVAEAAFTPEDTEILARAGRFGAVVLDNARLMTEAQQALEAQQRAYGEVTRQAWEELLRSQSRGYVSAAEGECGGAGALVGGNVAGQAEGRIVQEDAATLAVPVKSRDEQVLGVVRFRRAPEAGVWNAQQVALVETLTDRLSQALESARLYEESRRLALQERLVARYRRASGNPWRLNRCCKWPRGSWPRLLGLPMWSFELALRMSCWRKRLRCSRMKGK